MTIDDLCAAVRQWDARSGATAIEESGAWYVLGVLLEQPAWRRLVEVELQEIPTVAGMRRCLRALVARGGPPEEDVVARLIRGVDAELESLSEDHAKVVRRRRRWLAAMQQQPDADPQAAEQLQALLSTEAVWEEMRRYRVFLAVWRELTAALV